MSAVEAIAAQGAGMRGRAGLGGRPARAAIERVGDVLVALLIFFTCFTFLRPSPYDFIAIPAMAVWFVLGLRVSRAVIVALALLVAYACGLAIALVPYLDEALPVEWTIQSGYLVVTGFFFVTFFSNDTDRRVELGLKAYLASCLFAAACGIFSYFDPFGSSILFAMDGRASGVFEDPNLLGSFLILSVLYLVHNLLTGRTGRVAGSFAALLMLSVCIFLSFSRGSWAAAIVGLGLMMFLTWRTSISARVRGRIARLSAVTVLAMAVLIGGLFSVEGIRERFVDRAQVTKDYDEGETGRFGNQRRGMLLLLERPAGFGPLRWRQVFTLDPHNSYIGSFANGGWLAGFAFLGLVLTTSFVGFRLCLSASPSQRYAQIVFPALLMFFLQALQIDIEKWRHVYMMLGMVWGLEAARWAWLKGGAPGAQRAPLRLSGALTDTPYRT